MFFVSAAWPQDLPESVTQPYVAYTQALEAGDLEAALEAAGAARSAGESARIDPFTLAVLTDNHAELLAALGQHRDAARAYAASAELLDGLNEDWLTRAQTWRLAASSALDGRLTRDAVTYIANARDRIGRADLTDSSVGEEASQIILTEVTERARAGRHVPAGLIAREGLESDLLAAAPPSATMGMLAFHAGVAEFLQAERSRPRTGSRVQPHMSSDSRAAFWLSAAHYFLASAGMEGETVDAMELWTEYLRNKLSSGELIDLDRQLSQAGYLLPPEARERRLARQRLECGDNCVDAELLEGGHPRYPIRAGLAGAEGFAVVRFDINPEGGTDNIRVLYSLPYSDFGVEAVRMVERWRYSPRTIDGEPVWCRGFVTQFSFSIRG
ncbi:energy transducer TonB [Glycocaulis abyssi]|uniref:Protein TonB n=1 Tax=Glycocaulis abyssi TaxID=1433403 RepID=A0ABV9NAE4_9PROT